MKALIAVLCLCVAAVAGAVGAILVAGPSSTPASDASRALAASSVTGADSASLAGLDARIETLSQDLSAMRVDIQRLEDERGRAPALAVPTSAVAEHDSTGVIAQHRTDILKVIEEDRQEQARLKEEARQKQIRDSMIARADRIAKQLKLGEAQQQSLADVYVLERQKTDELRNKNNNALDPQAARDAFRSGMNEIRDWRSGELTKRLGADIAQEIEDADPFRGGRGPGGPNGFGPPPGG
jgi:hypothetical protein